MEQPGPADRRGPTGGPLQLSRRQVLLGVGSTAALGLVGVAAGPGAAALLPDPPAIRDEPLVVEGYASRDSVNQGEALTLHVRATIPAYDVHVWRMGWHGGAGGRRVASYNGLPGVAHPVPAPDPITGLVQCTWPAALALQTDASWTSGAYLAALHRAGRAVPSAYIPFVVRDDASDAPIVHQLATATWQAYNNWGGKSLYDYNSTQTRRAQRVSFDRPYLAEYGAGSFFTGGDYHLIRFLEREGYHITYTTSADTELRASTLRAPRRVLVTSWHDEYWSTRMRDNLEAALGRAMHALFLSSNNVYWRTRFEAAPDGRGARVMVCGKEGAIDAETILFRDAGRPENALLGGMYDDYLDYGASAPWIVANATHWLYSGTALAEGAAIARLVGYEWDRTFANGATPAGTVKLSRSPVTGLTNGASLHEATLVTRPNGAQVFNAGTNYWAWALSDEQWGVDERVRSMTRNLLAHTAADTPTQPSYRPVSPTRLLDTRTGAPLAAATVRTLQVTGVGGVPASGVGAVVCNLTLADTTAATYAVAWANGTPMPATSSVNAPARATVANLAFVAPGADGRIALFNAAGSAHVIVDVVGWLPAAAYAAVTPTRLLDTRQGSGPLQPGEVRRVPVTTAVPPAAPAACAVVNLTVADVSASTYLLAYPTGAPRTSPASSLNAAAGATVANLALVGLAADGSISVSNAFGRAPLIVDLLGYVPSSAARAIDPVRILDTRPTSPLGAGEVRTIPLVTRAGVPADASGVIVNLTLTDGTDPTWLLAYPAGGATPLASSVNAGARATVANLAVVDPGRAGAIDVYNAFGSVHLIVDVVGWFV